MNQRKLTLESITYSTESGKFGLNRKARMVFRVTTKNDSHTYTLPLTCVVDDDVSEDEMIAYAKAELQEVIIQICSVKS